ncbi:hypothetical protein HII36_55040 [Nonomuraea sp. NN258]|uniref:hypothetical protein n=1 Tax=Nonomuraea antri TaxID=2730852 RepID=UPI0015684B8E|nr:hypothetical protein [Nonomuraea antri]NRQ40866.1 hypothetical protein [Nonomuraea antri]
MAREEARLFTRIWRDEHFRALTANAQRQFLFLLSQDDLTYAGTLALRERRWANTAAGLTIADVRDGLAELAKPAPSNPSANPSGNPSTNPSANPAGNPPGSRSFVVIDENTEELLVRSLIRLDGVWKIPNLMLSARRAAELVESAQIRAVLLHELHRIPIDDKTSAHVRAEHALFVQDLGGPAAPPELVDLAASRWTGARSRNGRGKGSKNGSPNPSPKGRRGRGKGEGSSTTSPSRTNTGTSEPHGSDHGDTSPGQASAKPSSSAAPAKVSDPPRLDVERVCKHLADKIEAHGLKRPTIGQTWRDAARRMLDLDGIPEQRIHGAIDWAHTDEFWHRNILSPASLRKQYQRLYLAAKNEQGRTPKTRQGNATAYEQAMAHALATEAAQAAATGQAATAHPTVIPGTVE